MSTKTEKLRIHTVCFTGHRSIDTEISFRVPTVLKGVMEELIARGARRFLAGGAIGFDTIAALSVLELKEKYPDITLELVLPCRDQSRYWDRSSVIVYKYIMRRADKIVYVNEHFSSHCMYERNRRLVDESDLCLAYLARSSGGSAYTFGYALSHGKEAINLHELVIEYMKNEKKNTAQT